MWIRSNPCFRACENRELFQFYTRKTVGPCWSSIGTVSCTVKYEIKIRTAVQIGTSDMGSIKQLGTVNLSFIFSFLDLVLICTRSTTQFNKSENEKVP